jgi:hypothetical protein
MGLGDNMDVFPLLEIEPQFLGRPVCILCSSPGLLLLLFFFFFLFFFLLHHHHHDYKDELLCDNCFFVIRILKIIKPFEE